MLITKEYFVLEEMDFIRLLWIIGLKNIFFAKKFKKESFSKISIPLNVYVNSFNIKYINFVNKAIELEIVENNFKNYL